MRLKYQGDYNARKLFSRLVWCKPADVDNLVVLIDIGDRHGHIIIAGHDLISVSRVSRSADCSSYFLEIITKSLLQKLGVFVEERKQEAI